MAKIYTKSGDKGLSSLIGKHNISKSEPIFECLGALDELNSLIGVTLALPQALPKEQQTMVVTLLTDVQQHLFEIGAMISSAGKHKINLQNSTLKLEQQIDACEDDLEPLKAFILPGGTLLAAQLHHCRTLARRAERRLIALRHTDTDDAGLVAYLNRLSDFMFVLGRWANSQTGHADIIWKSRL